MSAFDLDPTLRWAFCMTHPDDEISICAWIHKLVQNGNPVFLSWTHSTPIREAEARASASLLGVPSPRLNFFRATDGSVCEQIPELLPQFEKWFESAKPDRVCCGAFEQGHLDHDSTNYLVNHTFNGPVFEIPFYHSYLTRLQRLNRFSDPSTQEVLDLNPDEQRFKKTIARQYPSQNIWSILLWYEICNRARLRPPLLAKTERMRLQTHKDFNSPNHPPHLAAKVSESDSWRRWLASLRVHESAILLDVLAETAPNA